MKQQSSATSSASRPLPRNASSGASAGQTLSPTLPAAPAGARLRITRAPAGKPAAVMITMPAAHDVDALMRVMLDLRQALMTENDGLRRGMPPATGEAATRKDTMAATFRLLYRKVLRKGAPPLAPQDARRLYDLGVEIKVLAEENETRLAAALEAREQRVQAVMDALRQHPVSHRPGYASTGGTVQSLRARFVDYGRDLLA